jgi:hypothetical protein
MAIDPRIALGVQPVQQQPNMLAQYAQVMAIRAAQQEMEGNEGVRSAFAQGAPKDPISLLQYGRQGRETLKALNESQIKQLEADQKRVNLVGAGAGAVLNNPTMETFTTVVSDLVRRGIYTPEQRDQAFATIGNDPSKIKSFVQPIFDQAISAEKRLADITSRRNQDVSSGASYGQLALAQQKYQDQLAAGGDIITSVVKDPETGQDVEMQFRRNLKTGNFEPVVLQPPSMRVDISPNSATSSYQPSGAGGTPNVLATQVAPQSGAAPATSINGLIQAPASAAPIFGRPKQPFRAPVAVMQDNQSVLVPADKAIGMQPATAFTEKQAFGKTETIRNLGTAIANLTDVIKPGGLLERSTGSGLGRAVDASNAFFGRATEGAKAAAALAPIADLVLKMVPRFEGPQSDKDTQSYKEAAGQLANSGLPNETRREAAKVIIRLMTERKDQFGMTDQVGGSGGAGATADPLGIR